MAQMQAQPQMDPATGMPAPQPMMHDVQIKRVMKDGKVQLVFTTVDGASALTDSFTLRRTALMHKIAYYTTVAGAKAAVEGIAAVKQGGLDVAPLQSYFTTAF